MSTLMLTRPLIGIECLLADSSGCVIGDGSIFSPCNLSKVALLIIDTDAPQSNIVLNSISLSFTLAWTGLYDPSVKS